MRILYIHQYFATMDSPTGTRSYEFAKRLVRRGHQVTVLTGPTHLAAVVPPGARLVHRFECDGVEVVIANIAYHQTMGYGRRVLSFLLFAALATWLVLRMPRPHAIYASSTPLTVAVPALAAWWLRRVPYVLELRDLWPAVPVAVGALRGRLRVGLARWLERRAYLGARHIVVLSPGMEAAVREVVGDRRPCTLIPNCCDLDLFGGADGAAVRRQYGWEDRCVFLHAGAMGRINGLDLVVRAADALRSESAALFVLAGEGREQAALERDVRRRGLANVVFLGKRPKREMPALFAAADVCLMTVAPFPILEINCANKWFDSLAAGKPVVLNYSGWQREVLESAGAGYGCCLGDDHEFVRRLQELVRDAQRRAQMGRSARRLGEARFSRDSCLQRVEAVLNSVANRPGRSARRRPYECESIGADRPR